MLGFRCGARNQVMEWSFCSSVQYAHPFAEVELEVLFTDPDGNEWRVPAFWSGDSQWAVRFAPRSTGTYAYRSICSDEANAGLHGRKGTLEVAEYQGRDHLTIHGGLRVSSDGRRFEHLDGEPFFWLGDTWWMSLSKRLGWPDEFQLLTADRVQKGFTVIQIVAGLYPDMSFEDQRSANEAGFPWTEGYGDVNPAYFDMADLRISHMVRSGLVPCIVGSWGYYLPWMGLAAMKKHWRYLVARWGAYPVVWCLAGEAAMPYYLSADKEGDAAALVTGWTEIGEYLRAIDPYGHPVTIHPTDSSRNQVTRPGVLDFEMLQTGHGGHASVPHTVSQMRKAYERQPRMPVINGEVCYEGILEGSREEVQRILFWACMLSGAAGHTYGANGIWQLNRPDQPYGTGPYGASWGETPWYDAYKLPGSSHLAASKRLLERYAWWEFEPHQEWVEPSATGESLVAPYAAGIPGRVRVIFFPYPVTPWGPRARVTNLEEGVQYTASYFDPKTGREWPLGAAAAGPDGSWVCPYPVVMQDCVLVLEVAS